MRVWQMLFSARGRIRRRDFWLCLIGTWLTGTVIVAVLTLQFSVFLHTEEASTLAVWPSGLYLACLWVSACLQIKRWHDRDKSGWWILINGFPLIGSLWAMVETGFLDGTQGPNPYGPSPKHIGGQTDQVAVFE